MNGKRTRKALDLMASNGLLVALIIFVLVVAAVKPSILRWSSVEDIIRQHPAVLDVVVVGVPSREWGEAVAAVVVPVWGLFELSEVEGFVRRRISGPKRPKVWKIEGQLPLNANGKVDRTSARALFAGPDPGR